MTRITASGSEEFFTHKYVSPEIASYVYYPCEYCSTRFRLVEPDNNFQAGGAIRFKRCRNPDTGEVKAYENRACGVCLKCCRDMMMRQQK